MHFVPHSKKLSFNFVDCAPLLRFTILSTVLNPRNYFFVPKLQTCFIFAVKGKKLKCGTSINLTGSQKW